MPSYTFEVKKNQVTANIRLQDGATMFVFTRGTARDITVSSRSYLGIDGNTIQTTVLNGGSMTVFRGIANVLTVSEGGQVNISSGGSTSGTTVHNGGEMYIINGKSLNTKLNGGTMNVGYSNGHLNAGNAAANDTVVNSGGRLLVSSGGKAVDNKINNAGEMLISSAGSASETTVSSGGTMTIAYGGTHYNELHIEDGGKVIAEDNSKICFSLAGLEPSQEYFINNASLIEGNPYYNITVSGNQAAGTYKLAQNAAGIDSVNVYVAGNYYYADINNEGFFYGDDYYYLKRTEENDLLFIIAAPPAKPKIYSDNKKLTNQDVTLTAVFETDTSGQYSNDGENWMQYTAPVIAVTNGVYYFRTVNSENMYSQTVTYVVSNIDKDAPEQVITIARHPKNINNTISVAASDSSGIASIQYRIGDDESSPWLNYNKKSGIKILENNTVYIKSTDKAGNSSVESRIIELDTLPHNNWTDLKSRGASSAEIGRDIKYYDENPNLFMVSGWVGIDDAVDYHEITIADAGKYSFELDASDKSKFAIYQLVENKNGTFKLKSLQNTALKYDKASGKYEANTKDLWLADGTYYISMTSTNAAKGGNSDYSIYSDPKMIFSESKYGHNDDWQDMKTNGGNSEFIGKASYNEEGAIEIADWVGLGDVVDYFEVKLEDSGKYNFTLSSDDKSKFTIYQLVENKNGTFKLKSLQNTALKYDKASGKYQANTKDLWLADGTYYISMTSTNAAKGGNAAYNISSNAVEIYKESKNGHNDDWQDMKLNGGNSEFIGKASYNEEGAIEIADWVGLGDAVDYKKLTIEETTKLSLSVSAEDKAKFTIYQLVENKNGTYKLKAVKSSTLAKQKYFYIEAVPIEPGYGIPRDPTFPPIFPIDPIVPIVPSPAPKPEFHMYHSYIENLILEGGTYYIAMTSTNAAKGGNAAYKINETDSETVKTEFVSSDDDTWKKVSQSDALQVGDAIHNWVGYGDAKDFFKFELTENGKVRFSAAEDEETFYDIETWDALHNKDIKLTCLNEKGKSVALIYDDDYTSKQELAAGTYYIGIQSTNAKKHWTEYNIAIETLT